jgi:uncharacterized glyoxalase superfamily protein PhnB
VTGSLTSVGHVGVHGDVDALVAFYRDTLGLAVKVFRSGVVGIFALGDADFFVLPGKPGPAGFDLAADDVDALCARLVAAGVPCTDVRDSKETGHRSFELTDPAGNRVSVVNVHTG